VDFRPYDYVDKDGRPAGFTVALIQAVADKMGMRVRFVTGSWDEVWNGLVAGQLDVLPTVTRTPSREALVDFSLPHTETFDAFFVREGRPPIKDLAAAAGKEIVVSRSDAAHHQLVDRKFAGKLILVETFPEGLRLIASSQYDAMLCSKIVGVLEGEQAGIKGVTAGPPISDYKRVFSFAVRKDNAELLEKLNQGLNIVKADGTYDRLYRKWLGAEIAPPPQWQTYFWQAIGIFAVLVLIAVTWVVARKAIESDRQTQALTPQQRGALFVFWRYALAIVAVAAGYAVRVGLEAWVGRGLPAFVTFYPAVMVAALLGGIGPGLLATAATAAIAAIWIMPPLGQLAIASPVDRLAMALFCGMGLFMTAVARLYRRSRAKAAAFDREEALRETRREKEFLANLLEAAEQPFAIGHPDGRLGLLNRAYEQLTGYTAAELRALDWSTVLTPAEWRDHERQNLEELHRTGRPVRYEKEYVRKDGTRVPIELLVSLGRDAAGRPEFYYSFLTDITARKQAEQALRESEQRWATTLSSIGDAVIATDVEGKITFMNAVSEGLTGWTHQEASMKPVTEVFNIVNEHTRGSVESPVAKVLREGMVVGLANHTILVRKDGTEVPIDDSGAPIRDSDGNSTGVVLVFRDITGRKQAEEALRERESRYRELVQNANSAILRWRRDGTITFINEYAQAFFGYSREEALGKSITILVPETESTGRDLKTLIDDIINHPENYASNINENIRRDGRRVWMAWTNRPVFDENGQVTQMFAVGTDITDRKRAEEELVKAKTLAENRAIELQAIMEAVPALVFITHDPQGSYMTGNRATYDMLGVPLLGNVSKSAPQEERPVTFRAMRDGQEIPADQLPVQQAAQGHEVRDYELDLVLADGTRRTIFGNATPLRGPDGGANGAIGVFIDITRRKETEEALRERMEELAALFDAVPMPVFIAHDPDCLHLTGNRLADEILRISHGNELSMSGPEETKPRHFRTFKDGRELRLDELPAQRAARGAHVKDFEFTLVFDDGMVRHVLGYGTPLLDDRGHPRGTVAVLVDITERKAAEEAVQRTLQRLYTVLSSMYGGLLLVTDEGRVEFANQALCDYFDLNDSPEDLVGLTASEVFAKIGEAYLDPDEAVAHVREIVDRGQPVKGEQVAMRGGRELLRDFIPIRIGGQSYGRLWCHTDITERKAMERALQKARDDLEQRVVERTEELANSEKEFRLLAEAMPQIVWITRADGWNIYFNQQWVDYTGLTLEESYGHGWNTPFHPDDQQRAWDAWQNAVTNNGTYSLECRLRKADGTYRWWLIRGVPVIDEKGGITKWFGTCTDIEEIKRTETQLRQAQKMEALGTMSGGIAHDFNNILAAIIGFSELLEGHVAKGSRDARHLHRIMEAGIRGRELVRQMLAFARKAEQEKRPLPVSSIVKESVKLLRATTPSTIDIKVNASNEALILGDPTQIQQVLMNLCTNAVHAMQEKGGSLDIELSDHSVLPANGDPRGIEPGQYVKLSIRDTGIGISADVMDKIFDPFFTTKKLGEGTGLGLSVVHGIVKQHDGYITVQSEPGKGSVFTVYFLKITGGPEAVAVHDDEIPTGSERILFVDDEEALVEMCEDILAELGYDVTSRMSSREALSLLKEDPSRFDLVITDQTMPEMTGVELAREVLAIRADMPIIMCTGFSYVVDADKARAAGIKAFAMKPLTKREIARTVRHVLDE
jgi:PAS domain S-box-containing protein